tara:strand:+ start:3418 stop:5838 length:2421 start_codon:yes stop_codon:yes gene_type:complete
MKRFMIIMMLACFGLLLAQDAAGTYKLTGTSVRYTSLTRQATVASVSDAYGLGVNTPVSLIPINSPFFQLLNGPFNEDNLELGGAFLNVTFNEDGSGTINEGSYYPTTELDEETCTTAGTVLPITDELAYTSNLTPSNYVQTVNYLGLESLSPFAGGLIGSISLSQSEELDFFTAGQSAGALGACLAGFYFDGTPCDASFPGNDCDIYEACASAGYASKGHDIETIPDNGVRDMYVEWHAIDGPLSQSGYGDDILDPCEDGLCVANASEPQCFELGDDGSVIPSPACSAEMEAMDRIFGIPYFGTTAMNPDCGFNMDILGDAATVGGALGGGVEAACVDGVSSDADENGFPDVVDGCFYLASQGLPEDEAASAAFMAACMELGFDEGSCAQLLVVAQASIVGQLACYDIIEHDLYPPSEDGSCDIDIDGDGEGDNLIPVELEWDCYGLAALTAEPDALCEVASGAWVDQCVLGDSAGRDFYLLDAQFALWGGFFTWNALQYSQTGDPSFLVSDGTFDFDPACLGDGDFSDCAGRLAMAMDPLCVPEFQVREVHIDFDQIDDCAANGDVNLDDVVNILDVVNLVQAILGLEELNDNQVCNADINQDEVVNILDVVAIVQAILGNRGIDATEMKVLNNNNTVSIESNGYIGAVQMTLSHDEDFSIELTDNAFIAEYNTEGTTTTLMIVNPESAELFSVTGEFEILETLAANSNDYVDVINPEAISLGSAYPNPFNPTTSFELTVGNAGHVTMNVYNVMGQVVETLVNNTMDAGSYNITWDAANFSSGMYVVKAETTNGLASQKVMLVK